MEKCHVTLVNNLQEYTAVRKTYGSKDKGMVQNGQKQTPGGVSYRLGFGYKSSIKYSKRFLKQN